MRFGFLPHLSAFWVGVHWSPYYRRLCINVVPCLTVFVVFPGGKTPAEAKQTTKALIEKAALNG